MPDFNTIVHLSPNSEYFYDFYDRELHYIGETGISEIYSPPEFRKYERKLLELFIRNKGKALSRFEIVEAISERKDANILTSPLSVDNHIGALRKVVKDKTASFIETIPGTGYRYHGEGICEDQLLFDSGPKPLRILTKHTGGHRNRNSVIHRDKEFDEVKELLSHGERAILLTGFGGIGKTSIAQVLYDELKLQYDRIAWISYHGSLVNSFLESMDLYENISDPEKRWAAISSFLKNDRANKIIFIDNADRDESCDQDPECDPTLQDIVGWMATTVILTSRIESIPEYTAYNIDSLGSQNNPGPCIDLFYHYYDSKELENEPVFRQEYETVCKLVSRAGYHTYAIELLARSARYEDSLASYLSKIEEVGFQFPTLRIHTNRHQLQATAAQQLRLLFNPASRSEIERHILWDFSVLPEGTALLREDVQELLSYSQNDLHRLQMDSWLLYRRKYGFYLHPLVREIVHFDLINGKAPCGTAKRIIDLTISKKLVSKHDPQSSVSRKLNIAECVARSVLFGSKEEEACFCHRLGRAEFLFARKRLASIEYLGKALELYDVLDAQFCGKYTKCIANALYHLGYVKSATVQYRSVAQLDLRKSLDTWEQVEKNSRNIAMAHDHLGYVLADDPRTYNRAKVHLLAAIDIYEELLKEDDSISMRRSYATACDNLGYLLSKAGWNHEEAEHLLNEALSIRKAVLAETGDYSTDVAWTSFNLGEHVKDDPDRFSEAEDYYRCALSIREELERKHPGTYINNVVFTQIALAKHLSHNLDRIQDVRNLTERAQLLRKQIDWEHTGHFSNGMANDLAALIDFCKSHS